MKLLIDIIDFRRVLKEKCDEIFRDGKFANEFYIKICEVEEDDRFTVVYDVDMEDQNG